MNMNNSVEKATPDVPHILEIAIEWLYGALGASLLLFVVLFCIFVTIMMTLGFISLVRDEFPNTLRDIKNLFRRRKS